MSRIIYDIREKASGIPVQLIKKGFQIECSTLSAGDYIINDQIIIERKSAKDFVQSIIDNRLFDQCAKLRKATLKTLMVIEGNPYKTSSKMNPNAIRGAVLSVLTAWQIPIIFSLNTEQSADLIVNIALQCEKDNLHVRYNFGQKPKANKNQQINFIRQIPSTGSVIAKRILKHFGSIKDFVNSNSSELERIKGIGKSKAKRIIEFLNCKTE